MIIAKLAEEISIYFTTFFWAVDREAINLFSSKASATKLLTVLIEEKA